MQNKLMKRLNTIVKGNLESVFLINVIIWNGN